ncbi:type I secretion target repeat protein [Salipiger mucosus DSM 16094]|uniref:Type I secretion target repeat protein n=2 Tax=Salipiger mucosus TaxID=263378 RepID=S9S0W4_9RHOB|nr:type I secretion target repeat protein [Salipiger mucosus DSM 16094]
MPKLELSGAGEEVAEGLFGANILAHRNSLDEAVNYDELVDDVRVHTLRYPGGSVTEDYFDFANPDREVVFDRETGEQSDFIQISEFMQFAEDEDLSAVLVLNTRDQLSDETDANGDRYADIDEEGLRQFVNDAVTGKWGDVDIAGFEIGNEYWGSGRMSATEYGRVASEMATIIDDELRSLEGDYAQAADTEVIVQMGTNFNHSSLDEDYEGMSHAEILDAVNDRYDLDLEELPSNGFTGINNEIIMSHFDTPEEVDAMDAVVGHVYSKVGDDTGDWQRSYMLDAIDETWGQDPRFADKETYVSEWNQHSNTGAHEDHEDYGLKNSHELLNMIEEFADHGVDEAQVWPLLQNSSASLSLGREYQELTPTGKMYAMMSENLPGKSVLDMRGDGEMADNASFPDMDVHGFYGDGEAVFYLASNSDQAISQEVDVSGLLKDAGTLEITVLGVEEGQNPGDQASTPTVRQLDPEEVYNEGYISADLEPYEIMQVKVSDFEPTEAMQAAMDEIDGAGQGDEGGDTPPEDEEAEDSENPEPDPPAEEDPENQDEDEDSEEEGGFMAGLEGLGLAAALLPLLVLMGAA